MRREITIFHQKTSQTQLTMQFLALAIAAIATGIVLAAPPCAFQPV